MKKLSGKFDIVSEIQVESIQRLFTVVNIVTEK
jgi:hypothetical protein